MIRKFEHGFLCLRNKDKYVCNIAPRIVWYKKTHSLTLAQSDNQVFKVYNPLVAPRILADWTYQ